MTFAITRLLSIVIVVRRPLVDPDALLKPPPEPALKTDRDTSLNTPRLFCRGLRQYLDSVAKTNS